MSLGPVVVSVNSTDEMFRSHNKEKGIISNKKAGRKCDTRTNHVVLAVGYGFDEKENMNYVLIKNSWGDGWGEGGFARISLDETDPAGTCGILSQLVQAIV